MVIDLMILQGSLWKRGRGPSSSMIKNSRDLNTYFFCSPPEKTTQSESSNHMFKRNMNTMINLGLAYFHRNYKWGKT